MAQKHSGQLRIVGGAWRSRPIQCLDTPHLRPTPDRVRETLFNWLTPVIESSSCLDLFAGSGALGFEAISRGAQRADLVDQDPKTCRQLQKQIDSFDASTRIATHCTTAEKYLASNTQTYTLVFLDPPFRKGLVALTLKALTQNPCLIPGTSIVYIEHEPTEAFSLPEQWTALKQSQAGNVAFCLLATALTQRL